MTVSGIRRYERRLFLLLTLQCLLLAQAPPANASAEVEVVLRELAPTSEEALPALPGTDVFPVQLVVDDDSAEAMLGVGAVTASQFLWFNQFDGPGGAFELRKVWVLFPAGPEIAPGEAIELVIYQDENDSPEDGSTLVRSWDEVVQVADGNTFSVYSLPEPLFLTGQSDLLIGVINRFVETGVSPSSQAAAFDTSLSQSRSWLATWLGDPPDSPDLASAANVLNLDSIRPGNWMIRGFGVTTTPVSVPALGDLGRMLLLLLLATAGWAALGMRK